MRQNKRKWALIVTASMIFMTGCGNAMPEVTDEQMNTIGEYAAVQLLKYDADSRSRLVDAETIEREEKKQAAWEAARQKEPEPTPEPEGMGKVDDTPVVGGEQAAGSASSLEEYFELPQGMSVQYGGYQICDSYPQSGTEDFFALDAAEDKKLLVLSFQIENTADSEQSVDLFAKSATYKVTINGSYIRSALTTILLNDISTYKDTLPAHSSKEVVLLVEIDESLSNDITSIVMNLKNESKSYTIQAL